MVGKSVGKILVLLCVASALVACGGDSDEEVQAPNKAPLISGEPRECILPGGSYDFLPNASDPDGDALSFSINGKPGWADFSSGNGRLTGTPTVAVGVHVSLPGSYLPPEADVPAGLPPQTTMTLPVQTAVWTSLPAGAPRSEIDCQLSDAGSYRPPVPR